MRILVHHIEDLIKTLIEECVLVLVENISNPGAQQIDFVKYANPNLNMMDKNELS